LTPSYQALPYFPRGSVTFNSPRSRRATKPRATPSERVQRLRPSLSVFAIAQLTPTERHSQAIGKLKLLPASTLAATGAAREATAGYNGMVLTIAVAYGGREEIADAVQALLYEEMRNGATLADAIERITPAAISRHLYMAGSPR
jgi:undecaprenyl diphosphate synthase